jgi:hypothetical protein
MKGGSESSLISGQAFKNLCKYNLDDRYSLKPIDSSLQKGDSVFLKFGDIPAFIASSPSKKVVLVVGNMDETFDDGQMTAVGPYVTKVYSVNSSAKGAIQLPLGFRDDQYTSHKVMVDILNDNSKPGTKEILCLVNFLIDTNGSERSKAKDRFNGESWATISDEYMNYNKGKSLNHSGAETKQLRADYYAMLKRTKCVVCPPGTGVDTHRVYETLYFGAIPIIKSSFLDPMYERVGGCWIVNDWSEVTEEECNRRWSNRGSVTVPFEASNWFPGKMSGGRPTKKIFNLDLHISVIEDVTTILKEIYGDTVEVTNWNISSSGHHLGKKSTDVKIINQSTWKDINADMIKKFQDEYDDILKDYDGFVVTHTPVFAMLYEKYGKPIIIVNSCRYDQPFCWNKNEEMLKVFNESLKSMQSSGQLIIVSNNIPDQKYLKEKAGVDSIYIPSLCLYTGAKYNPKRDEFTLFENKVFDKFPSSPLLKNRPDNFSFKDLFEYKGIVHMPYDISSMSLFEQYFAGVPLFFPTKEFYTECVKNDTVKFIVRYDLNDAKPSDEEVEKWLNDADYYRLTHINHYSSFQDCIDKLKSFVDHDKPARLEHIKKLKNDSINKWKKIWDGALFKQSGGGEQTCKYISTRGVMKSCDVYCTRTDDCNNFDEYHNMKNIKNRSTIFVHFNHLKDFMKKLDTISYKIILVTGDGDQTFPDDFWSKEEFEKMIENPKIIHMFSINSTVKHPKVTSYPIGVNYHTLSEKATSWGKKMTPLEQDKELHLIRSHMKPFGNREIKCYSNFHFNMQDDRKYTKDRRDAKAQIPAECIFYEPHEISRKETWENQTKYAFVVCPHGNGLDCHRQWEALCLGCIPIVKKSVLESLYDELPVLIVNEWSDINQSLLDKTVKDFRSKKFNYDRLLLKYWVDKIKYDNKV